MSLSYRMQGKRRSGKYTSPDGWVVGDPVVLLYLLVLLVGCSLAESLLLHYIIQPLLDFSSEPKCFNNVGARPTHPVRICLK